MKLLYLIFIVSCFLLLCEGETYWTSWTTAYPVGPGINLKGKMVTVSQDSGVTFFQPYFNLEESEKLNQTSAPQDSDLVPTTETARPEWTTQWPTEWTTGYYPYPTTTPYSTSGVSVCLRFMTDFRNFVVFKLSPRSPLTFTWDNPYYDLRWFYYSQVSLNPRINLWNSVHTQPWTSVCLVLDSRKNVAQVFQGGAMSIRKILRSRMVWSGEPVVDMSGFDGQVTDLEVWDYPLQYREVLAYMQNYGSSGTVLTWSNIAYKYRGNILVEDTYSAQMKKPISSSHREQQPIRSRQGRDKRLKYKQRLNKKARRVLGLKNI